VVSPDNDDVGFVVIKPNPNCPYCNGTGMRRYVAFGGGLDLTACRDHVYNHEFMFIYSVETMMAGSVFSQRTNWRFLTAINNERHMQYRFRRPNPFICE